MIDILEVPGFLDPRSLQELREALEQTPGAPATLLSQDAYGVVRAGVRRTTRLSITPALREQVLGCVLPFKAELEAHFGQALGDCEEPQCLRYEPGDFFVAHQDGNTPLIYDASRFRRVSVVLCLSTPSDDPCPHGYDGGALVFHGAAGGPLSKRPPAGTLVAFRAETTHEVLPVTQGVRHTIAFFFRTADAG